MKKTHVFTKTLMVLILFFTFNKVNSQEIQLDSLAYRYFSQEQIDTMSSKFILVQNYLIKYSWNIYRRWDKQRDTIVEFNRDTIDIRPFLNARKEDKPYKRINKNTPENIDLNLLSFQYFEGIDHGNRRYEPYNSIVIDK